MNFPSLHVLAVCLVIVTAAGCVSTQPDGDTACTLVIRGVTLIDGNGGPPLANAVVVIQGNRITAVGRSGEVRVPRGALVENASGHYLIPGLIDVHAHAIVPTCESTPNGQRFAGIDWELSER
ncbi:hypothetical protein BH23BAC4_BH23BAC4_08640 [soil metagenome]